MSSKRQDKHLSTPWKRGSSRHRVLWSDLRFICGAICHSLVPLDGLVTRALSQPSLLPTSTRPRWWVDPGMVLVPRAWSALCRARVAQRWYSIRSLPLSVSLWHRCCCGCCFCHVFGSLGTTCRLSVVPPGLSCFLVCDTILWPAACSFAHRKGSQGLGLGLEARKQQVQQR